MGNTRTVSGDGGGGGGEGSDGDDGGGGKGSGRGLLSDPTWMAGHDLGPHWQRWWG